MQRSISVLLQALGKFKMFKGISVRLTKEIDCFLIVHQTVKKSSRVINMSKTSSFSAKRMKITGIRTIHGYRIIEIFSAFLQVEFNLLH